MDHRSTEQRRNNGGTTWLTCDELAFVQRLGTHSEHGVKTPLLAHLQRYIEAASLRQAWGKIDKAAVLKEAKRLLRVEQRKAKKDDN